MLLVQESQEQEVEIPAVPIPEILEGVVPIFQQDGPPLLEPQTVVGGENGSTRLDKQPASAAVNREVAAAMDGQTSDPEIEAKTIKVWYSPPSPLDPLNGKISHSWRGRIQSNVKVW